MFRPLVAALAVVLFAGLSPADDKAQKNQMVKGTIKAVNVKDGVLIVNQKVKNETVERQLDIKDVTEFVITIGDEKKELAGKNGLALLEGKEGAQVQVKCDKDVNVLKVSVRLKAEDKKDKEKKVGGAFVSYKDGTLTLKVKASKDDEGKNQAFKVADDTKVTIVSGDDKKEGKAKDLLKDVKEPASVAVTLDDGDKVTAVLVGLPKKKDGK
jgi:hypothetical protein